MPDTPNFGFHKNPRFSVNHVAEYISTDTAGQRETVIRNAKFPRKPAVVPYTRSRHSIEAFLAGNSGNLSRLDEDLERLEAHLRREPEGWMKTELRRNIDAIEAFKKAFTKTRAKRFRFVVGPTDMTMLIGGVRINARLNLTVTETTDAGVTHSGGCTLLIANTEAARKKIEERRKAVAALIHWGLQSGGSNIEPLERLCFSFDVFGLTITTAPKAIDRLRANITSACDEATARWPHVAPPSGYDGPDWH